MKEVPWEQEYQLTFDRIFGHLKGFGRKGSLSTGRRYPQRSRADVESPDYFKKRTPIEMPLALRRFEFDLDLLGYDIEGQPHSRQWPPPLEVATTIPNMLQ